MVPHMVAAAILKFGHFEIFFVKNACKIKAMIGQIEKKRQLSCAIQDGGSHHHEF